MVKVGDKVWVKMLNKYNFRGTIMEIENNVATINVPVHYSDQEYVTIYKDIEFLTRVPETLKELEKQKEEAKCNGCN